MRFSSAAILVLVLGTAAAQHRGGGISSGGMRPGPAPPSNGNPFMPSNGSVHPGFGPGLGGPWWRSQSWPRWGPYRHQPPSLFFALPTPIVPYPVYPADSPYYWQPPPEGGPAFPLGDVSQVPTTVSPSLNNPDTHFNADGSEAARASDLHIYNSPGPPPSDSDDHPALIALKNNWAYSVLSYWEQGEIFHFITSHGDHMQVPATQVERIYPSSRQSHVTDPQSPPVK
jgi:hypothetical protein